MFRNGRRIEIRHEMPWIATKTGLEAKLFQMFTGKHVKIFGYFLAFFWVLIFFCTFSYVPAALEFSRNGEKSGSAAVSGGAFSFHDMLEHAHNLHPNGNEHSGSVSRHHHHH